MKNTYCFSILALTPKYQLLAKKFADDLGHYSLGIPVVIGTDNPNAFRDCSNVFAFRLKKRGILHCYHDKRFVIERALQNYETVIQIDADTRIFGKLPEIVEQSPGLAAVHIENLVEHVQKYTPERLDYLCKLANKLGVGIDTVSFIGEALFAISADQDKASEFIQQWDSIARYLELHGIHAGEGNAIGLAAAKAELKITQPSWLENIERVSEHCDASQWRSKKTLWDRFKSKVDFHYRFNKARVAALKDFDFYYR